ncbi:hypothetical protein [Rubripirellula tenax]|nr:hypothetical protein [Rubripirellula tenax]
MFAITMALLGSLACVSVASASDIATSTDDIVDIRLNWRWKSPTPTLWDLQAEVVDGKTGRLIDVQNRCAAPQTVGAIERSEDQSRFRFSPRNPTGDGGVRFRLRCSPDAVLRIKQLATSPSHSASDNRVMEVAVRRLVAGETIESKGESPTTSATSTWSLGRESGDALRIASEADHGIMHAGQHHGIVVAVNALHQPPSRTLTLAYSFYEVGRGQTVHSGQKTVSIDEHGNSLPMAIEDGILRDEGVYEFRCEIETEQDKLWSRLRRKAPPLVAATESLAVMPSTDLSNAPPTANTSWTTVELIQPSQSHWSVDQWIPKQATRLISGDTGVVSELTSRDHDGETVSVLAAQTVFQTNFSVANRHMPHKITLRYPADLAGSMKIEVGSGEYRNNLPVSFVLAPDDDANLDESEERSGWLTQTCVYYPSGDDQIWLTNLNQEVDVSFESIRIEAGPERIANANVDRPIHRAAALRLNQFDWFNRLTEDLLQRDTVGNCSDRTISFYRTWIATERLCDHAAVNGMNSVAVVACDGHRALFDTGHGFDPVWFDGDDQVRGPLLMQLAKKNQMPVFLTVDALAQPESANVATHIANQWHDEPAFAGMLFRFTGNSGEQLLAPEKQSDALESVRNDSPADVRWLVETNMTAILPPQAEITPLESLALPRRDRTTMRSLFQQRLSAAKPSSHDRPIAAAIGQRDDGSAVSVCYPSLDRDAILVFDSIDPTVLMVELPIEYPLLLPRLENVLVGFESMPIHHSKSLDAADPSSQHIRLHVSTSVSESKSYVSVVSLAPWNNLIAIDSVPGQEWEVVSGDVSITRLPSDPPDRIRMELPAGEVVVLRRDGLTSPVLAWTAVPAGGPVVVEKIKQRITSIVERIGILGDPRAYDGLVNGSFEQSGGMGLVGWLHAQHPPQCVRVDEGEAVEGHQSVLLTTDATVSTRTWLVSETVTPPESGRLAVSMACRGELKPEGAVHRLRVSIEATQNGSPIRQSADVEIPCNGKWRARSIVLEADFIDPNRTESVRLTIDSLSGGRVWIDDIRLHDQFPLAKERAELQSQAFLAVQGLQRGNLTPSARLLQNHWARFLLVHPPDEVTSQVNESGAKQPESTGVAERVRSWLPRPLRF